MSLFLWSPADNNQNGFRKHYKDGKKVEHNYPYWLEVYAEETDPTPERFASLLQRVWDEDLGVAFSQFSPKPLEELADAVCRVPFDLR